MNNDQIAELAESLNLLKQQLLDSGFEPDEANRQINDLAQIVKARVGEKLAADPAKEQDFKAVVTDVATDVTSEYYKTVFGEPQTEMKLV